LIDFATLPEAELKINVLFKATVTVIMKAVLLVSRKFSMQGPTADSILHRRKMKRNV